MGQLQADAITKQLQSAGEKKSYKKSAGVTSSIGWHLATITGDYLVTW